MRRGSWTTTFSLCATLVLFALVAWSLLREEAARLEAALQSQRLVRPRLSRQFMPDSEPLGEGSLAGKGAAVIEGEGELAQLTPWRTDWLDRAGYGLEDPGAGLLPSAFEGSGTRERALPEIVPSPPGLPFGVEQVVLHPILRARSVPDPGRATAVAKAEAVIGMGGANPLGPDAPMGSETPAPSHRATTGPSGGVYAKGERESLPMTKGVLAVYRGGRVEARAGRKITPAPLRLPVKARLDLGYDYGGSRVGFGLRIDAAGRVTHVAWPPLLSSGSNEVDMAVYESLWSWWFEPQRDKNGRPAGDEFVFGLQF